MPLVAEGQAPYAPTATILEVIHRYRDRGLQTPFTQDVLVRAGVTESLAPRTLLSLKQLDLLDERGNPTDLFEGLQRAPSEEFPARLEELVRSVYSDVFQFADPTVDSAERVADAFRQYRPAGQRNRMVTLFLGLCEAAGVATEAPTRTRSTRGASRSNAGSGPSPSVPTKSHRKRREPNPLPVSQDGALFGVTEKDIALLDEAEFAEVWSALGKVARARARGSKPATSASDDVAEEGGQI